MTTAPWAPFTGRSGSGFQPAMVWAHSRACALSVMPGNSRRSLIAAANSPPLLIDGADRSSVLLGDDEHRWSMGATALAHKPRDGLSGRAARSYASSPASGCRSCQSRSCAATRVSCSRRSLSMGLGRAKTVSTTFRSRSATSKSAWSQARWKAIRILSDRRRV